MFVNMYNKIYRKMQIILSLFCLASPFFAQTVVRNVPFTLDNATWISAMNGRATSAPVETSYGISVLSSGRLIFSCTSDGAPVVQHSTGRRDNSFLTVLRNDFFMTVTDSMSINFINPSGVLLWSRNVGFEVTRKPLQGRDGRIFVVGSENISCYGLNGARKWELSTEEISRLPVCQMNDGSLLVFLERKEKGRTVGLRVSPFGERMEEIIFVGNVLAAESCDDGALLVIDNGNIALSSVVDNVTVTAWATRSGATSSPTVYMMSGNRAAVIFGSRGASVHILSLESGEILNTLSYPSINASALLIVQEAFSNSRNTLVLADSRSAASVAFDGTQVWSATLPDKSSGEIPWEQIAYTKTNCLVFFTTNWAIVAFKTEQDVGSHRISKSEVYRRSDYSNYYAAAPKFMLLSFETKVSSALTDGSVKHTLLQEDIGEKEIALNSLIMSAADTYRDTLSTISVYPKPSAFMLDITGTCVFLQLLPFFETDDVPKKIGDLLMSDDQSISAVRVLLEDISQFPYDPEKYLLGAIESLMTRVSAKDELTYLLICDALFSLCRFMGEPYVDAGAKDMIANMVGLRYSEQVRNRARDALTSIATRYRK